MFHDGRKIDKWQCKNYISVEKRQERGFELHIGNLKKEENSFSYFVQLTRLLHNLQEKEHLGRKRHHFMTI